jgi:hypothetical protein
MDAERKRIAASIRLSRFGDGNDTAWPFSPESAFLRGFKAGGLDEFHEGRF